MQQIVEVGGDGMVCIGLVLLVSLLLFLLLLQILVEVFLCLCIEFYDQINDVFIQVLQCGEIDFGIGVIDSLLFVELLVYLLCEDFFVVVLYCDDLLVVQVYLLWKQLVGWDIVVFLKGNIQWLVVVLVESYCLMLIICYQVDYIEILYGLVCLCLVVVILLVLYIIYLQDLVFRVVQLQQLVFVCIVVLMCGLQVLFLFIEDCFFLLQVVLCQGRCLISMFRFKWLMYFSECEERMFSSWLWCLVIIKLICCC